MVIKGRHIQVVTCVNEGLNLVVGPERLQLMSLSVLYNVDSFVHGNAVMKGRGRGLQFNGAVWNNFRRLPALFLCPINTEHVICEEATENELFR